MAYFIICYAVSWGMWLPLILSRADVAQLFAVVGIFGPALACLLVSRASSPLAKDSPPLPFWLSFIAAWIVSVLVLSANSPATSAGASPALFVIFAVLAFTPAFVIGSAVSGSPGIRRTLSSLVRPRGCWGWYVLAMALPLASRLLSVWISRQIGWELLSDPMPPSSLPALAGSVLVAFLYTLFYAGGLNEETGWTGLALPRLQASYSPLVSTIVLWALWMLWHVPLHLSGYFNLSIHVLVGAS